MQPDDILYLGKATVMMIFHLSMPIIGAATTVGLLVALVQTLIQLQEQKHGDGEWNGDTECPDGPDE